MVIFRNTNNILILFDNKFIKLLSLMELPSSSESRIGEGGRG
jgi:hypothetical protein